MMKAAEVARKDRAKFEEEERRQKAKEEKAKEEARKKALEERKAAEERKVREEDPPRKPKKVEDIYDEDDEIVEENHGRYVDDVTNAELYSMQKKTLGMLENTRKDIKRLDDDWDEFRAIINGHGKRLDEHDEALSQHGKALAAHGETLEDHEKRLKLLEEQRNNVCGAGGAAELHVIGQKPSNKAAEPAQQQSSPTVVDSAAQQQPNPTVSTPPTPAATQPIKVAPVAVRVPVTEDGLEPVAVYEFWNRQTRQFTWRRVCDPDTYYKVLQASGGEYLKRYVMLRNDKFERYCNTEEIDIYFPSRIIVK